MLSLAYSSIYRPRPFGFPGSNIISIKPTADLASAAKLLSKHHIGALVVVDADGRLVGILSERDIVRTMADVGSKRCADSGGADHDSQRLHL